MDESMNQYVEGETAVCRIEFRDVNDVLQDPGSTYFSYETPDGTVREYIFGTNAEIVRVSQGIYTVDLDTTGKPGTWHYRFFSTGTGKTARQSQFHVVTARPQA